MVSFRVAEAAGSREGFEFSVAGRMVLVAGSRHKQVARRTCRDVLEGFHNLGFHFFIGCAGGLSLIVLSEKTGTSLVLLQGVPGKPEPWG